MIVQIDSLYISGIRRLVWVFILITIILRNGYTGTPRQENQNCNEELLGVIEKSLRTKEPKYVESHEIELIASACKVNPENRLQTIVIAAYRYVWHASDATAEDQGSDTAKIVVALVDNIKNRIIAYGSSVMEQGVGSLVEEGCFRIDTAPYKLTDSVRAFGIDFTSGYSANCGDGYPGAYRTLYIREGKKLRPVLDELMMSYSYVEQFGWGRCYGGGDTTNIVDRYDFTIVIGDTITNGFRDLLINATARRNIATPNNMDGKNTPLSPFHYRCKYNGKKYCSGAEIMQLLFNRKEFQTGQHQ